jgi:hypothetical protein
MNSKPGTLSSFSGRVMFSPPEQTEQAAADEVRTQQNKINIINHGTVILRTVIIIAIILILQSRC